MLRSIFCLLFILSAAVCLADDAEQRIIERYKEILVKSPKRGASFDRVYGHYVDTGQSLLLYQDCQTATQNRPDEPGTWILYGLVAERRNKTEEAAHAFQTAADLEPNNHLAMLYLGELLLNQRRFHEAVAALEQARERLQGTPNRNDLRTVLQTLALAYTRFGDPQKSLDAWNQLAALFPNDPDILVQVAETMEYEGRLDDALRQYRRLLTMTDDHAERVRISLAAIDIMLRLGNDEPALNDLDSLLGSLDSESYLADAVRNRIDRIFDRARDPRGQIEFYQKRIDKEPNDTASLLRLVRTLQRTGRQAEAETLLLDTIKVSPSNIPLRLTLIDLFVEQGNIGGAIEQFQAIDTITPAQTDYLIRWGTLALKSPSGSEADRRAEAAKIWRRIAEAAPNDPVAAVLVADLFSRNKFFDEAEQLYKKAMSLRQSDFSYREHLAMFYHRHHIKGMVLETLSPTGGWTFKAESGQLLLTLGYINEAAQKLEEAVQAAPKNWSLQYRYFEALLRQNTPESFLEIAKLYSAAERNITEDEQFVLFLQQTVQLLKTEQKTVEALKIVQASAQERRDVSPPVSPSMRSLWHLAMLYQAEGNFTAAVTAVEKAMETAPASLPLLRFAAELYEQSGNPSKAIALYQKLTQDDPARSGEHWKRIIAIHIQRGELPQALESSRNLLGRGTENAERLRFVADLFLGAQRQDEAVKLLQQALILEPGNTDVLRILAQTLAESDRHEEAIELLWRLYERLDHPSAKLSVIEMLATEYNTLGRDDELIEHLQQLSRHYDHRRVSMQALARAYTVRGEHEEAQDVLEILLDLPDDSKSESDWAEQWVLRELVAVTERQDDFAAAVRYQEMLCQKSADLREHNHLFYLYDKLEDTAQVRRLFFDQILRQGNWQDRLDLIDMMIRREQHDIVLQVLDFLDIHESEHWAVGFRRILIKTYQNEPIRELILEFRSKRYDDPSPVQTTASHYHHSFVFTACAPAELNAALIFQNQFLPVLFYPERHDTGLAEEKLPEEFYGIRSFHDARFLTLGLLLREAFYRERTATGRPAGTRPFPAAIEELRTMLPADSEQYDVLMDRLRLEVWLLDLFTLDEQYQIFPAGVLKAHVDERVCQRTIWQIVRKSALGGTADWQPALFQILLTECINELVAERFKTVLSSDTQLAAKLVEILDTLCRTHQIPPLSAEDRSRILDIAAYLVRRSSMDHEASQRSSPLTLAQKTERILSIWSEFVENPQPKMQGNLVAYNTLLWILRAQNREEDAKALESSLPKIAHQQPLWQAKDIYEFTNPVDENLILFRALSEYDSLEGQLRRFQSSVTDLLPLLTDREDKRTFCEFLFQDMSGSVRRLQRYDIFTPSEQALFRLSTQQIWNYLQVPSTSQQGRLARQFFGADSLYPSQQQVLNSDQMTQIVELDRSLQQIAEFAFQILDELKLEPADLLPAFSLSAAPKFSLIRYRSELQGDRPVERTIIYPLLQNPGMTGDFSAVDELFCRILLLRRALDTKAKSAGIRNDDGRFVPISGSYTAQFAQVLENRGRSSVPSNRTWSHHVSAVLGDLLQLETQPTEPGSDTELLRLVQKLETDQENRSLALPEKTALALLYVRLSRFDEAVSVLDSMELPSSGDLPVREWIIAGLAVKHGRPDSALLRRGNEAANRLLNFRLLERDMLHLATVLQHFQREEEAQRILDHLVLSVSDHRLMTELFYKMNAAGDLQKENAAKIAQRILQNPAFLQNSRRLTADVFLLEATVRTLQRQSRTETVIPILESRLRGLRDKTDSRILLAKLYLELDRREEAKALALELALNPTAEPERRQMIVSLLVHFGLQRELESMNRLLLERNNRPG